MTEVMRVTDSPCDRAGNLVITGDGKLAIAVQSIDVEKLTVRFAVNPIFEGFENYPLPKRFAYRGAQMNVSSLGGNPVALLVDGIVYEVRVKDIGRTSTGTVYCDFAIITGPD